jgi:hypothetical protein
MKYLWLVLLGILTAWHLFTAISLPIRRWALRTGRSALQAATGLFLTIVCFGVPIAIALTVRPVESAILMLAALGFVFGFAAYLLRQRFPSSFHRIGITRMAPMLFPLTTFACFASGIIGFIIISVWPASLSFLLLWYLTGLTTAEIAIRTQMRESKIDRKMAILMINDHQHRKAMLGPSTKYPFP